MFLAFFHPIIQHSKLVISIKNRRAVVMMVPETFHMLQEIILSTTMVEVKTLKQKIVGILIGKLSSKFASSNETMSIVEAYKQLSHQLSSNFNFEIIFVAIQTPRLNEDLFESCFSKMPWLAIPYNDFARRRRFVKAFRVQGRNQTCCVIIDEKGVVLTTQAAEFFCALWGRMYPFTKELFTQIGRVDLQVLNYPTLEYVLCYHPLESVLPSDPCAYVIRNDKTKVSISDLNGKFVGLYFVDKLDRNAKLFAKKLQDIYQKLKNQQLSFEIVMIYLDFIPFNDAKKKAFEKDFNSMPWLLALPYMDGNYRRLARIFRLYGAFAPDDTYGRLKFFDPSGQVVEDRAPAILNLFGIEAYPFTRKRITEIKIHELEQHDVQWVTNSLGIHFING